MKKKRKTCDDLMDTDSGTDNDMSENNSRDQAKHHDLHRTLHSLRIGHDDLSVDTAIDLESNVTRNTNLSASTVLATEITEHTNDMVAEENQMSSDDLISTGDYSDCDILDEEKNRISKNDIVWVKKKYGEEEYC